MNCQSCGMPMKNAADSGTNADGSANKEYCSYCFQKGKFLDEGITLKEKIDKNVKIAASMGMPEAEARKMASSVLPKLKKMEKVGGCFWIYCDKPTNMLCG